MTSQQSTELHSLLPHILPPPPSPLYFPRGELAIMVNAISLPASELVSLALVTFLNGTSY